MASIERTAPGVVLQAAGGRNGESAKLHDPGSADVDAPEERRVECAPLVQ